MTHLTKQDRCKIENFLNAGLSLRKIGKSLHKSHTTISREIKKHRIVDETSKRHRKNFCSFKNNCMKRTLCKAPPPTCKIDVVLAVIFPAMICAVTLLRIIAINCLKLLMCAMAVLI